jgi:hypothetical protein
LETNLPKTKICQKTQISRRRKSANENRPKTKISQREVSVKSGKTNLTGQEKKKCQGKFPAKDTSQPKTQISQRHKSAKDTNQPKTQISQRHKSAKGSSEQKSAKLKNQPRT